MFLGASAVMGFGNASENSEAAQVATRDIVKRVEPEDVLSFGFIPEFVGRLPVVTVLEELTEEQLIQVMTQPRNALVKQYAKLLSLDNVELEITPDGVREIAKQAISKGTGARALRSHLERVLRDVMFEIPASEMAASVTINAAVVRSEQPPIIRQRSARAAA